jgi:hypothetical protein
MENLDERQLPPLSCPAQRANRGKKRTLPLEITGLPEVGLVDRGVGAHFSEQRIGIANICEQWR